MLKKYKTGIGNSPLTQDNVGDAEERLKRFCSIYRKGLPRNQKKLNGMIESPLVKNSFHETILRTELSTAYIR
ncbi:hypothetical protein GCM10020331_095200 [Ectobacillus funiculus]